MVCLSHILLASKITTPKALYKHLMRECAKLPLGAKEYYKHHVRQSFKQHVFEPDPKRIEEIIDRALQDAVWVVKKYTKNRPA